MTRYGKLAGTPVSTFSRRCAGYVVQRHFGRQGPRGNGGEAGTYACVELGCPPSAMAALTNHAAATQRVMEDCFLVLVRHFVRVNGKRVRLTDTRFVESSASSARWRNQSLR